MDWTLLWSELTAILSNVDGWVAGVAGSLWMYPAAFLLITLDSVFPPLPSEMVLISAAVASAATGAPWLPGIVAVAIAGAWCGDQLAFWIGSKAGTERLPFLRSAKGRAAVAWARRALQRHGATFVIAGRYVPMGRIAVNMTAGAVGYPRRRFMAYSAVAAVVWALTNLVIGVAAGAWLSHAPFLATLIGIAAGITVGLVVDPIMRRVLGRHAEADGAAGRAGAGEAPASSPPSPVGTQAVRATTRA